MNIFSIFKRNKKEERSVSFPVTTFTYANLATVSERTAMLLSVVYRCVDLISNSVAQLPLDIYDSNKNKVENELSYIINDEPNTICNRFTFVKLLISAMILRGNAFAIIERDDNYKVKGLHYVAPENVEIRVTTNAEGVNEAVYYVIGGTVFEAVNVLHLINYSYDGIQGVSTIQHAANSIQLATQSEATAKGFFNGGCNLGGVLTVQSMLNEQQKQELKNSWQTAFGTGTGTPNGIAVLEGNMQYQPITVKPSDAQLLESRQFNVIDICRFFGVSPTKAFDLSKSSYSTIEAESIAFLSDTIQPIISKLECEFKRKLLTPTERRKLTIKFDTSVLLRTDKTTLANYFSTLFNIGTLSQNEIRNYLDLPPITGGDKHFVQVNLSSNERNEELSGGNTTE